MNKSRKSNSENSSRLKFIIPVLIVVALVIGGGIYWYVDYLKYISTDDAHVDGHGISLSAKILGRISAISVEEGDTVVAGQLLITLDSSDMNAQRNQLLAVKNQAVSQHNQAQAKYTFDRESIAVLRISKERAEMDLNRAQKQFEGKVISAEQFEHSQKTFESAKAQYDASTAQLELSRAQIATAVAGVKSAEAQIGVVETQLGNTRIYAPAAGTVAKKWLLSGDVAQPGQTILSLNQDDKSWIAVYIEETNLADLFLGQKAKFTVDAYPGVTFTGHLSFIGSTTASRFSLIPPSNASGNFTKITQRVPLKIAIDGTENGPAPDGFRLLPGMSAEVKIVKK